MKPEIQTVTLNRSSNRELEMGIMELEARGYELIAKGLTSRELKMFNYRERRGQTLSFVGSETVDKHSAIMRREYWRDK